MATDLPTLVSQLSALCTQLQAAMEPSEDPVLVQHTAGWTKEDALLAMHCITDAHCSTENHPHFIEPLLRIIRYLRHTFGLTAEDFGAYNNYLLLSAINNSKLWLVQYLVEDVGLIPTIEQIYRGSNRLGCPKVLQYLNTKCGITKRAIEPSLVVDAVQHGDVGVLKCLHQQFNMGREDFYPVADQLVSACLYRNNLSALKYLKEHIGIHVHSKPPTLKEPLHVYEAPLLEYLRDNFGVTITHIPPDVLEKSVWTAAQYHNTTLMEWLKSVGLKSDTHLLSNAVLRACNSGQLLTVQWLKQEFPHVGGCDINEAHIVNSAHHGHLPTLQYVVEEFEMAKNPLIIPWLYRAYYVANGQNVRDYLLSLISTVKGVVVGPRKLSWKSRDS